MDERALAHTQDLIEEATSIVVLTGAGVSAESGVPTFREPEEGLWAKYDPMELATIEAFHRDPQLVTRWYHWRFERCATCKPNPAHDALAVLQQSAHARGATFTLLTQNIDGLHQQAGSTDVIELHGTIHRWRAMDTGDEIAMRDIDFSSFPPRSASGALLRPNVVWFGEMLPPDALMAADRAARACDVFLSIGTSSLVYPAAGLIELARAAGGTTIEINRDPTPITDMVDVSLLGLAGEILPRIV
jgi:NAD-dependent protein deacetylase/lipoamidase